MASSSPPGADRAASLRLPLALRACSCTRSRQAVRPWLCSWSAEIPRKLPGPRPLRNSTVSAWLLLWPAGRIAFRRSREQALAVGGHDVVRVDGGRTVLRQWPANRDGVSYTHRLLSPAIAVKTVGRTELPRPILYFPSGPAASTWIRCGFTSSTERTFPVMVIRFSES